MGKDPISFSHRALSPRWKLCTYSVTASHTCAGWGRGTPEKSAWLDKTHLSKVRSWQDLNQGPLNQHWEVWTWEVPQSNCHPGSHMAQSFDLDRGFQGHLRTDSDSFLPLLPSLPSFPSFHPVFTNGYSVAGTVSTSWNSCSCIKIQCRGEALNKTNEENALVS